MPSLTSLKGNAATRLIHRAKCNPAMPDIASVLNDQANPFAKAGGCSQTIAHAPAGTHTTLTVVIFGLALVVADIGAVGQRFLIEIEAIAAAL